LTLQHVCFIVPFTCFLFYPAIALFSSGTKRSFSSGRFLTKTTRPYANQLDFARYLIGIVDKFFPVVEAGILLGLFLGFLFLFLMIKLILKLIPGIG